LKKEAARFSKTSVPIFNGTGCKNSEIIRHFKFSIDQGTGLKKYQGKIIYDGKLPCDIIHFGHCPDQIEFRRLFLS
jgi:hypothetical protein